MNLSGASDICLALMVAMILTPCPYEPTRRIRHLPGTDGRYDTNAMPL